MSALDRWGTYEKPCPGCGGKVEFWYFSGDCMNNPVSGSQSSNSGIQCVGECKRKFTREEWHEIAPEEANKF